MPQRQILITLDDSGQLSVQTSPASKIALLGMLELAKDTLHDLWAQQEAKVQPASAQDVAALIKPGN